MRLFVDRAAAAQPVFRVTEQNAARVVDICHRLDGIPLAIELAAARVRALSVQSIAERLTDRFRLLTGGDRTALPRQQTLRALIDWSYDLLTPHESALFRRTRGVRGRLHARGRRSGRRGRRDRVASVLDLLSRLVEKSLVALDAEGARYRLLETVRQYAHERLVESAEGDDARTRHLAFYLALAEKARPGLVGPEQGTWLARLDLERENLLSAHACCDRVPNGAESGLRLVYAIKPYWLNRGLLGVGYRGHDRSARPCRRAGTKPRALRRPRRCRPTGDFIWAATRRRKGCSRKAWRSRASSATRNGSRPCSSRSGWPASVAATSRRRAGISPRRSRLARELGNKRELAAALNALAQLHRMEGELDAAEPIYGDVVAIARELRDREIVAIGLLNLAMVSIGRGSTTPARGDAARSARDRGGNRLQARRAKRVRSFRRARGVPRGMGERGAILRSRGGAGRARRDCAAIPPTRRFSRRCIATGAGGTRAAGVRGGRGRGRALTYDSDDEVRTGWSSFAELPPLCVARSRLRGRAHAQLSNCRSSYS